MPLTSHILACWEERVALSADFEFSMAFLSGRWVAKVVETSTGNPRAVRRVLINHELVKASKLVAGDLLLLTATPSFDGVRTTFYSCSKPYA